MRNADIGIDLGTTSVLICLNGKDIVLREPSVVALNQKTGQVMSVGEEAKDMLGKTPDHIQAIMPLEQGVIADYAMTEEMIKYFLRKVCAGRIIKPRVIVCVPSQITEVESRTVVDAAVAAGARKVYLIEEPVAAAIGAGIDITRASGVMIVDMGGGTTDIALISLGGISRKRSVKVGGNVLDAEIVRYVRNQYNLLIGQRTAERIKMESVDLYAPPGKMVEAKGRNLLTGLPQKIQFDVSELSPVLLEALEPVMAALQEVLETSSPELAGDIHTSGITLTGGGSLLGGLERLISERMKVKARAVDDPVECVARGTGMAFAYIGKLQDGFLDTRTHIH